MTNNIIKSIYGISSNSADFLDRDISLEPGANDVIEAKADLTRTLSINRNENRIN